MRANGRDRIIHTCACQGTRRSKTDLPWNRVVTGKLRAFDIRVSRLTDGKWDITSATENTLGTVDHGMCSADIEVKSEECSRMKEQQRQKVAKIRQTKV